MHSIDIINRQNREENPPAEQPPKFTVNENDTYVTFEGRTRIFAGSEQDHFLASVKDKSESEVADIITGIFAPAAKVA